MNKLYFLLVALLISFVSRANIDPIVGPSAVCGGTSVTYTDATAGGTWSASASALGTIDPVTGVLSTHYGFGTITIIYTAGPEVVTMDVHIENFPDVIIFTGPSAVCIGSSITFTPVTPMGGTWSTSNSNATITSDGVLTGVTKGSVAVYYTITDACGSLPTFHTITVDSTPDAGTISGVDAICNGASVTLTTTGTDGAWSATNSAATVTGGTVTAVSSGIDTIKYTVTNSCGISEATHTMTVDPEVSSLVLSGAHSVCALSTVVLSASIPGGIWGALNGNATVSNGVVTGAVAGVDTIVYTVTNSCGSNMATYVVTINPLPVAGSISGLNMVCQGSSATLTASAPGGIWTISNTNATISGGVVTGVAPGSDTVIYIVANSCGTAAAIYVMTINALPNAGTISGASAVCVDATTMLTTTGTGGAWSVLNSNASVTGGNVTGIAPGIDTIAYTAINFCGVSTATYTVTVNDVPSVAPLTGANTVCEAATITLSDATAGGVWSMSNGHASVSGGLVNGISEGVDTVSYTLTNTCGSTAATYEITVNPLPVAGTLSGSSIVCTGATVTLTSSGSGGIWSAANSNASVSGGVVSGNTVGIDTVLYTVTNSCGTAMATHVVTVDAIPSAGFISGPSAVCQAASMVMTDAASGGTWSASNSNATVSGGTVIGISAGSTTISYTVTNICGSDAATKTIAINPLPETGTISGPGDVCPGNVITLTSSLPGGTWAASNANVTVSSTGDVTGVTSGLVIVSYSFTNACGTASAHTIVVVNPLPNAGVITGTSSLCAGGTVALASTVAGGTWSMSNGHATITATGLLHGASGGIDTALYTFTNMCGTTVASYEVTINALPSAGTLSGPSTVCVLATATLTSAAPGGTWSASNSNATIAGGVVTGVTPGTVVISYVLTNTCGTSTATRIMTVSAMPDAGTITGVNTVCEEATTILFDPVTGGAWSASNSHATVIAGIVTGISAGTVTISYVVSGACGTAGAVYDVTVNPLPETGTISGSSSVCAGDSITLVDLVAGGSWSASNGNATVSGGIVAGVTPGTVVIYYSTTNGCGTRSTSRTVTVNTLPDVGVITGSSSVCIGDTVLLTDTIPGGTWSCTDTSAIVIGGIVTGLHSGMATISYTTTNSCGSSTVTKQVTVNSCGVAVSQPPVINNEALIYPNPAVNNSLNIDADIQDYNAYTIMDNEGRIILHGTLSQRNTMIDIGSIAPGIYCIKLSGDNSVMLRKIVRQ